VDKHLFFVVCIMPPKNSSNPTAKGAPRKQGTGKSTGSKPVEAADDDKTAKGKSFRFSPSQSLELAKLGAVPDPALHCFRLKCSLSMYLRAVSEHKPYASPKKEVMSVWDTIASVMGIRFGLPDVFTAKNTRQRWNTMLEQHNARKAVIKTADAGVLEALTRIIRSVSSKIKKQKDQEALVMIGPIKFSKYDSCTMCCGAGNHH
jgi:hypothetical protein